MNEMLNNLLNGKIEDFKNNIKTVLTDSYKSRIDNIKKNVAATYSNEKVE